MINSDNKIAAEGENISQAEVDNNTEMEMPKTNQKMKHKTSSLDLAILKKNHEFDKKKFSFSLLILFKPLILFTCCRLSAPLLCFFDKHSQIIYYHLLKKKNVKREHKKVILQVCVLTQLFPGSFYNINRFIRDDEKDSEIYSQKMSDEVYGKYVARKYYDALYKEFVIADLSKYEKGMYGLRWRVKEEVFSGKGETICGNKACSNIRDLHKYEVNFSYLEKKQNKNALVNVMLCDECHKKLLYCKTKKKQRNEDIDIINDAQNKNT